jgi:hypothetical protein
LQRFTTLYPTEAARGQCSGAWHSDGGGASAQAGWIEAKLAHPGLLCAKRRGSASFTVGIAEPQTLRSGSHSPDRGGAAATHKRALSGSVNMAAMQAAARVRTAFLVSTPFIFRA